MTDPPSTIVAADDVRAGRRFVADSATGLIAVIGVGLGLAAVLWFLAGPLVELDVAVARAANDLVAPRRWLVAGLTAVTTLGADLTAALVLGTLVVALLVRRRRALALYVVVAGAGGAVLAPAIKGLVGRLRPVVDVPVAMAPGSSFPSGHTLTVTYWVGIVLFVALPAVPLRARRAVVAAAVAVVVSVGLTRVGLGVHYLTDVVAGWLLGTAWLALTAAAFRGMLVPATGPGLDPHAAADLRPASAHDPPEHRWGVAARLLVVAVLLIGVLLGIGQLVTTVAAGTPVAAADLGLVRAFATLRTPLLDAVSVPAAELGNTLVVVVGAAVAAVLAVAVLRRWRPAVLLVAAVAGETLMFMVVASATGRTRPAVEPLDAQLPPTSSFPSGHTAAAVALYGGVAVLVLGATRAWWRWLVVALAVVVVVLVAAARLYRGAHHPTDVLGSVLLTVPWLYALDRILPGAQCSGSCPVATSPVGVISPVQPQPVQEQ
ncbi:phosphatase PAP2 family protein [Pseudonocardia abyssalis]|uniref:Phosphatase PAP2 family protein n=1 Tax=Pseudonocardia abyssalis TaxID=2792008 RepID=A0ABS6UL74_9PSEU|nr:phosphatase PAP2 family protein [Pseudonocardia abyssalis]MBW0115168.1 phosphatase PAP2 family protein [Pseudonocardia abyssalis]MBW0133010.1 phosphatase PAP2 family protein [Pseudonocardia abyssalis]